MQLPWSVIVLQHWERLISYIPQKRASAGNTVCSWPAVFISSLAVEWELETSAASFWFCPLVRAKVHQ